MLSASARIGTDVVRAIYRGRFERSRDGWDTNVAGRPPSMQLVAERVDRRGRRADEHQTGILDGSSKRSPLGEEAVARDGRPRRRLPAPLRRSRSMRR